MIAVIHHSDKVRERGYHGAFGGMYLNTGILFSISDGCLPVAGWQLAGWMFLRSLPSGSSRGLKYLAAVVVGSWPSTHPLNIAWMSENTGCIQIHFPQGDRLMLTRCWDLGVSVNVQLRLD